MDMLEVATALLLTGWVFFLILFLAQLALVLTMMTRHRVKSVSVPLYSLYCSAVFFVFWAVVR